jgi:tRNA threonylcarbamoyladenosine biosynthesis protein TsaE
MIVHKEQLSSLAGGIITYAKEHAGGNGACVLALEGELGAGKTTLVQHIARALGIMQPVQSPTFVLMKQYETHDPVFKKLVHIDAYRIESEPELAPLHLEAIFSDKEALVCVEWPEKLLSALPEKVILLTLAPVSEEERGMSVDSDLEPYLQDRL